MASFTCSAYAAAFSRRLSAAKAAALRTAAMLAGTLISASLFAQTELYVVNSGADTISVINTYTGEVTATLKAQGHVSSIAYNDNDGLLYLPTHEGNGRVYLIDPATHSFVGEPIAVGAFPNYVTISPERQRAYVSNQFGALSVIDTSNRTVVADVTTVYAPLGSALQPEQNKLYVINNQTSELSVIDTLSNKQRAVLPFGCFNPLDVKTDPGVHKAFVTKGSCPELAVIDTNTDAVVATIEFPGRPPRLPRYIAMDPVAHRAYVSLRWGHEEKGVFGGIAVINTVDNSIVGSVRVGVEPARLALDAAAKRLYVTDRRGDRVIVVDTEHLTVLGQVHVGSDPVDIALVPARAR
jgi:YVTN family beta-propeller protein